MNIVKPLLAICILLTASIMPTRAGASAHPGAPLSPALEVESQIPCFFNGGYHLAIGVRYDRFRFRVGAGNSGRVNYEIFGLDDRNNEVERFYDDGSYSLYADYFLNERWHAFTVLGNHYWRVRRRNGPAAAYLRTIDAGLGLGYQYFFCRSLFIQPACAVLFRDRQSRTIDGETYRIPGMELAPAIRLGIRF